jgi:uncharacterized membrane protein YfcA
MELDVWVVALLCAVFFFTGILDGIAGGGGLISLPCLLLAGLPPEAALGTNKMAAYCGVVASLGSYARTGLVVWKAALTGIPASLLGSVLGARLLLSLDSAVVGKVLVFMLPLGVLALFMPKKDMGAREMRPFDLHVKLPLVCLLLGLYDGFFGPGSGSFMVIGLHIFLGLGLLSSVATSKMIMFAGGLGGVFIFALKGHVHFLLGLPLGLCCVVGNIMGSKMAMKVGPGLVRRFLAFSLVLLFASLVWKFWGPA